MTQWSAVAAGGWELAERPLWDGDSLVWVDVYGGALWRLGADGSTASHAFTAPVGFAALRIDGGYVVGANDQLVFVDHSFQVDADPVEVALPTGVRLNDGACDPVGRLWFGGACADGTHGRAPLYCYEPRNGELRAIRSDVTESNGLAWSPDGRTMYYVDTGEPVIQAYDYDLESGSISRRRDLVRIDRGLPDGLIVDSDGALWLAVWEGAVVHRYSPDGDLIAEFETPMSNPTCPALGGSDGRTLVVTSGWEGMSDAKRAAEPWAGHVISTTVDATGSAPYRLAR